MHCFPNCLSNGCKLTSACPCHGKLSFPPLFHNTIDWECIVRSIHCRHVNCYSGHMKEGLLKPSCFSAKRGWGICMRNAWFLVTWEAASKVLDRMCIPIFPSDQHACFKAFRLSAISFSPQGRDPSNRPVSAPLEAADGSLYIPSPRAEDAGVYICTATSAVGYTSREMHLSVNSEESHEYTSFWMIYSKTKSFLRIF